MKSDLKYSSKAKESLVLLPLKLEKVGLVAAIEIPAWEDMALAPAEKEKESGLPGLKAPQVEFDRKRKRNKIKNLFIDFFL